MTLEIAARHPPGLRERNKLDKLRRIKDAARTLFVEKGFDDTTTREIAQRAGVGLGTIFAYAENKRDLLFLIVNEQLESVTQIAHDAVEPSRSLIDNLLTISALHYRFFGEQPQLSRLVLREMTFYDSGAQAGRFQSTRQRLIELFGQAVELAEAQDRIATAENPHFVGWTIFCIFQVEQRRWLSSDDLDLGAGLRALERALALFISGLKPTPKALKRQIHLSDGVNGARQAKSIQRRRPATRS